MTHAPANVARWREEWPARYRAGATVEEIAIEAGVGHAFVHRTLRAVGVEMRPPAPRPGPRPWHAKVPPLLAEGLSCAAIGRRLGLCHTSVSRFVRRLQQGGQA